jgi:hypothetical protein
LLGVVVVMAHFSGNIFNKLVTVTDDAIAYNDTLHDDQQGALGRVRAGASAPTWRAYNHGVGGGVVFDVLGFTVGNSIYIDFQTSHRMKLNTTLKLHMHYILPNTTTIGDNFQFQVDCIAGPINQAYAVPSGSPFTMETQVAADDNTHNRVKQLATVPAVNSTVSTIYTMEISRIAASANEYGSEVYLKYFDCHFEIDAPGSRQEYVK